MPVKIEIEDNNLLYFSEDAKEELKTQAEKYTFEIIKETGRLEESIRDDDNSTPEITRTLVKKAIYKYKDSLVVSQKRNNLILIKITSTISIFVAGILCDFDDFKTNTVQLIIFIIISLIAAISTTLMFVKEGD